MNSLAWTPFTPPVFEGNPYERGRQFARHFADKGTGYRELANKRSTLWEHPEDQSWLEDNITRLKLLFPEQIEYLSGQADEFGLPFKTLFASSYAKMLKDRQQTRQNNTLEKEPWEECSTFAFPVTGAGALVAKNRDNEPGDAARHTIALHKDPAWGGNWVLGVSSVSGNMAASSGINSHGLAVVDNAVRPKILKNGLLKANIIDAILTRCRTVKEALILIRSIRHASEGNFVLGDQSGAVAAVSFTYPHASIEFPQHSTWVARTNHFIGEGADEQNVTQQDDIATCRNTRGRLKYLQSILSKLDIPWTDGWTQAAEWSAEQLCYQDETGESTLCWDNDIYHTGSGAIYRCSPPALLISDGPPMDGRWKFWQSVD